MGKQAPCGSFKNIFFGTRFRKIATAVFCAVALGLTACILSGKDSEKRIGIIHASEYAMVATAGGGVGELSTDISRLEAEILKARNLIQSGDVKNFLKNPHVVSALYYSDAFLEKVMKKKDAQGSALVLQAIRGLITPEIREKYMRALHDMWDKTLTERLLRDLGNPLRQPLDTIHFGHGQNHTDAIDLFIEEDASVRAMQGGVVVLAEDGWDTDDMFSTSSFNCGNTVIIYNPETQRFFRYCHLKEVFVKYGNMILDGRYLGRVGNTGKNASQKGHGGHLHLEINWYDKERQTMISMSDSALRELIRSIQKD